MEAESIEGGKQWKKLYYLQENSMVKHTNFT